MNDNKRPPPAPRGLSARARRLWRDYTGDFDLDATEAELLRLAALALDRHDRLVAIAEAEGLVLAHPKTAHRHAHPALAAANAALREYRLAIKQLAATMADGPDDELEPRDEYQPLGSFSRHRRAAQKKRQRR
jgi:hypothetical protein